MEIVDLSQSLEKTLFDRDPKIKYIGHKKGADLLGMVSILDKSPLRMLLNGIRFFLGIKKISYKDFPENKGLAWERIETDSHAGTHLDAPYHFGPLVGGVKAKTIDEVPLNWCISDGVVLNMSALQCDVITTDDLKAELTRIGYTLKPFDIVLIYTGAAQYWNTGEYPSAHKALDAGAIIWLHENGVKIIAIDAFTIDLPFKRMLRNYGRTKDKKELWPSHFIGRDIEYLHIENATNLDKLLPNPTGYVIFCLPVKIKNGSAGWTRLVAVNKNQIELKK